MRVRSHRDGAPCCLFLNRGDRAIAQVAAILTLQRRRRKHLVIVTSPHSCWPVKGAVPAYKTGTVPRSYSRNPSEARWAALGVWPTFGHVYVTLRKTNLAVGIRSDPNRTLPRHAPLLYAHHPPAGGGVGVGSRGSRATPRRTRAMGILCAPHAATASFARSPHALGARAPGVASQTFVWHAPPRWPASDRVRVACIGRPPCLVARLSVCHLPVRRLVASFPGNTRLTPSLSVSCCIPHVCLFCFLQQPLQNHYPINHA